MRFAVQAMIQTVCRVIQPAPPLCLFWTWREVQYLESGNLKGQHNNAHNGSSEPLGFKYLQNKLYPKHILQNKSRAE